MSDVRCMVDFALSAVQTRKMKPPLKMKPTAALRGRLWTLFFRRVSIFREKPFRLRRKESRVQGPRAGLSFVWQKTDSGIGPILP